MALPKAKVGDFEILILVEEEILQLEVLVGDTATGAEIHDSDELLEVLFGDVPRQFVFGHLVEELAAFDMAS